MTPEVTKRRLDVVVLQSQQGHHGFDDSQSYIMTHCCKNKQADKQQKLRKGAGWELSSVGIALLWQRAGPREQG